MVGRGKAWLARSAWIRRRSVEEAWSGRVWVRKCMAGWRQYFVACGPRAHECWQAATWFGCTQAVIAGLLQGCGPPRAAWVTDGDGGMRAFDAWQCARAWFESVVRVAAPDAREARRGGDARDVDAACGGSRRLLLTRVLTARRRHEIAARDAAVACGLEAILRSVEKIVGAAAKQGSGLFGGLLADCARAEAQRVARKQREQSRLANVLAAEAAQRRDLDEGRAADHRGYCVIESILNVRKVRGGGIELLVRWAGDHPDSWVRQSALEPSMRVQAARWARHVLGFVRSGPIQTVQQAGARFKRLLRGCDVGRARTSLVKRPRGGGSFHDFSDERPRKCTRVVDPPELMELRGELWRNGAEVVGGAVPKRRARRRRQ